MGHKHANEQRKNCIGLGKYTGPLDIKITQNVTQN